MKPLCLKRLECDGGSGRRSPPKKSDWEKARAVVCLTGADDAVVDYAGNGVVRGAAMAMFCRC